MKAKLKKAIRRVVLGYRASSDDYIAHLRRKGAKIGEKCYIYAPNHTVIDTTNPYMITIGDGVLMTGPVTILTHDYSTHIYNVKHNMELATLRPVSIGNNVFLGWGCTILAGTTIGDNVIIGANSVVSGNVEANSVYAGNPARRIMSIDEYGCKRQDRQCVEAVQLFTSLRTHLGRIPTEKEAWAYRNCWCGSESAFASYDAFCAYAIEPNIEQQINAL